MALIGGVAAAAPTSSYDGDSAQSPLLFAPSTGQAAAMFLFLGDCRGASTSDSREWHCYSIRAGASSSERGGAAA